MLIRPLLCTVLSGLLVSLLGCGGSGDPNRPETYPATGVVSYNGQPVEGATVMFVGSGAGSRGAVGKTDATGTFTMTTFEGGDGALPGTYRVSIFKTIVEDVPEDVTEGASPDQEPPSGKQTEMLPKKYKDANESGLTAEVTDSEQNQFTFELTD